MLHERRTYVGNRTVGEVKNTERGTPAHSLLFQIQICSNTN